jgi:hypothetical protein
VSKTKTIKGVRKMAEEARNAAINKAHRERVGEGVTPPQLKCKACGTSITPSGIDNLQLCVFCREKREVTPPQREQCICEHRRREYVVGSTYCSDCKLWLHSGPVNEVTPPSPEPPTQCSHMASRCDCESRGVSQGQAQTPKRNDFVTEVETQVERQAQTPKPDLLQRSYEVLKALEISVEWELATSIKEEIAAICRAVEGQAEPPSQAEYWHELYLDAHRDWRREKELREKAERVSPTAAIDQLKGVVMKSGIDLIADERLRQVSQEGWTPEHDDEHDGSELADAAAAYALQASGEFSLASRHWPFDDGWKPSSDPIRNLVKAGALIAAEIDRLQRVSQGQAQTPKCRHCGLRIYIGPGLTPASDKLWRHHATNFTECHGGLSTHAEPQVEGQAEPPSHGLECVDGGFRCLCGVTTNLLDWSNGYRWFSAHLLEIVARVSPTAAIDPFDDPKIKNILDRCEAGVVSFSNDDVSELLVRLKQGGTQSQVGERLEEEKPE